jgi:hypothetical protein
MTSTAATAPVDWGSTRVATGDTRVPVENPGVADARANLTSGI